MKIFLTLLILTFTFPTFAQSFSYLGRTQKEIRDDSNRVKTTKDSLVDIIYWETCGRIVTARFDYESTSQGLRCCEYQFTYQLLDEYDPLIETFQDTVNIGLDMYVNESSIAWLPDSVQARWMKGYLMGFIDVESTDPKGLMVVRVMYKWNNLWFITERGEII